ncbi:lipid IV(A) 3-deoxy-D-manno-octulosonic acid transferase [Vibrio ziniensis]|uniref:3-deoxy-D-manno-octulosonic acid transferase n=1 Tax=Vibrio ziniensis TaxID=2711221 RepID=A0A6G7CLL0_9VIBR|nr:lipid IV(A) 3-deoxy-D-manno-octulosonic acid transferase [Vibrio ziniensis]QIH42995.1 3-deoxy-D-manno-octulosonic acid transferase [Vibrio ziniensis]
MIRLLYTLLLALLAPFLLYSLYKKKEGKPAFGSRWKEHFGQTPKLLTEQKPLWIHAVSVGESIAAIPIIHQLKQQFPDLPILVTTTTSTGAQQIEKLGNLVEHRYMPLDFSFAVKRFIHTVKPQAFLIMETELWLNTLHTVSKAGIPIVLVNARLSEKSRNNYRKIQSVFNLLAQKLDLILCQHGSDAERFISLGVASNKVHITGSVKFDVHVSDEIKAKSQQLRAFLGQQRPIWIAASTHPGEDEQLFSVHQQILKSLPNALLIIVPRHPERFDSVAQLASGRYQFKTVTRSSQIAVSAETQVYVGDTMGEMLILIGAADVCFMAGSLIGDKVGGHNVLEPAALGKATITGPSYFNFKEIVEELTRHQAALVIDDQQQLIDTLSRLFADEQYRESIGNSAKQYIESNSGAKNRIIEQIARLLV